MKNYINFDLKLLLSIIITIMLHYQIVFCQVMCQQYADPYYSLCECIHYKFLTCTSSIESQSDNPIKDKCVHWPQCSTHVAHLALYQNLLSVGYPTGDDRTISFNPQTAVTLLVDAMWKWSGTCVGMENGLEWQETNDGGYMMWIDDPIDGEEIPLIGESIGWANVAVDNILNLNTDLEHIQATDANCTLLDGYKW